MLKLTKRDIRYRIDVWTDKTIFVIIKIRFQNEKKFLLEKSHSMFFNLSYLRKKYKETKTNILRKTI